jgi:uncharacterized spore protein YtfJ
MELNRFFDFLEQTYEKADVKAAFGEPQTLGEKSIIPVARIGYGVGLGFGEGGTAAEEEGETEASGTGGGGGGGGMATPLAVIEVTDLETKVIPITDTSKLALAGILMAAWNVFWIARTIRAFRAHRAGA